MAAAQSEKCTSEPQGESPGHAPHSPFPEFKESLSYQARLFARSVQSDYMGRITGIEITPAQAYVLGELWLSGPLSQVDLAERLDIGKATVGHMITRLERAGIVERQRIAADRRVVMIHLTDHGRMLREPLKTAAIAHYAMLEQHLGKDEIAAMIQMLTMANEALRNQSRPENSGGR